MDIAVTLPPVIKESAISMPAELDPIVMPRVAPLLDPELRVPPLMAQSLTMRRPPESQLRLQLESPNERPSIVRPSSRQSTEPTAATALPELLAAPWRTLGYVAAERVSQPEAGKPP